MQHTYQAAQQQRRLSCMPCQNVHQIYGPTMAHAWWCWQPRSVCQNDLLVCPLINYSLEAAGRLAGSSLTGRPSGTNRVCPRFFDQVGQETMYAPMANKHFFTKSCHRQTYHNQEQSRQKSSTISGNKVFQKSKISRTFFSKSWSASPIFFIEFFF